MMLCEKYKEQFLQPEVRCDTYIGIEIGAVCRVAAAGKIYRCL